jgi:hypothetical protein
MRSVERRPTVAKPSEGWTARMSIEGLGRVGKSIEAANREAANLVYRQDELDRHRPPIDAIGKKSTRQFDDQLKVNEIDFARYQQYIDNQFDYVRYSVGKIQDQGDPTMLSKAKEIQRYLEDARLKPIRQDPSVAEKIADKAGPSIAFDAALSVSPEPATLIAKALPEMVEAALDLPSHHKLRNYTARPELIK